MKAEVFGKKTEIAEMVLQTNFIVVALA